MNYVQQFLSLSKEESQKFVFAILSSKAQDAIQESTDKWKSTFSASGEHKTTDGKLVKLKLDHKFVAAHDGEDGDEYAHGVVTAHNHSDKVVGRLPYGYGETNVMQIGELEVDSHMRRKGVATAMLNFARSQGVPVQHYPRPADMTNAGRAFAKATE